ncbi:cache domain-containing protein [Flavihumibacter solisilvae]|nr:cache domain-containing protein [Flavihumibacter solisilvae]
MFRKIGSILLIAAPILGFLFLFYFHFVPRTRESLNKQGFLILKQKQESLGQIFDDLGSFFLGRIRSRAKTNLSNDNLDDKIEAKFKGTNIPLDSFDTDFIMDTLTLFSITLDDDEAEENVVCFNYDLKLKGSNVPKYERVSYSMSFKVLGNRLLESRKKIYFSSYFISAQDDSGNIHIVYNSPNLSVAERASDSAAFLTNIQFSTIKDITINDVKYKVYLYPFQNRSNNFVLCGLIKSSEYLSRQQSVPFSVAYGVLLVLLVALVALPYLKIFIINPRESLKRRDLVFQAISFFAGTAILLLVLHVLFMQIGTRSKSRKELSQLSESIRDSFNNQLRLAYAELKMLDSSLHSKLKNNVQSNPLPLASDVYVKSGSKEGNAISLHRGDFIYYSAVAWIDDKGNQVLKGRTDNSPLVFNKVDKRPYFNRVKSKRLYTIDDNVKSFSVEPLYSQTTNDFEVNLTVPSDSIESIDSVPNIIMASMSMRLSSLVNTIMPYGYDFYVIDRTGKILFQSNGPVTLQENFLEWTGENKMLSQAMANRQGRYLPNEFIFDTPYDIRIDPIDQMPWFLITLQNNDTVAVSYIHIIVFALFFLGGLYLLLLLCFVFSGWSLPVMKTFQLPADRIRLIRPGHDKYAFLYHGSFYLCVYMMFTLAFYYLVPFADENWLIGIISPIFALATLIHLFRVCYLKEKNKKPAFTIANLSFIFCVLFLTTAYLKLDPEESSAWTIGIFIVASCGISILRYDLPMLTRPFMKRRMLPSFSYYQYYVFLLLSVLCFSILPTHFFYEYAQTKEIALNTKTKQLHLARKIEVKASIMVRYLEKQKGKDFSAADIRKVILKDGVYNCQDSTTCEMDILVSRVTKNSQHHSGNVEFFDWFTNHVIAANLGADSILAEKDHSDDVKWQRESKYSGDSLFSCLNYYNLRFSGSDEHPDWPLGSLEINTHIPGILEYYDMDRLSTILIFTVVSLVLLAGLFLSIKATITRIFPGPVIVDRNNGHSGKENVVFQVIEDCLK